METPYQRRRTRHRSRSRSRPHRGALEAEQPPPPKSTTWVLQDRAAMFLPSTPDGSFCSRKLDRRREISKGQQNGDTEMWDPFEDVASPVPSLATSSVSDFSSSIRLFPSQDSIDTICSDLFAPVTLDTTAKEPEKKKEDKKIANDCKPPPSTTNSTTGSRSTLPTPPSPETQSKKQHSTEKKPAHKSRPVEKKPPTPNSVHISPWSSIKVSTKKLLERQVSATISTRSSDSTAPKQSKASKPPRHFKSHKSLQGKQLDFWLSNEKRCSQPVDVDETFDVYYVDPPSHHSTSQGRALLRTASDLLAKDQCQSSIGVFQQAISRLQGAPVALASTLYSLSSAYRQLGRHEAALKALHASLALRREHLSMHHIDTVDTLQRMSNVFLEASNYRGARRCAWQVLVVRHAVFGPNHGGVATALACLATVFRVGKRFVRARTYYELAIECYTDHIGLAWNSKTVQGLQQQLDEVKREAIVSTAAQLHSSSGGEYWLSPSKSEPLVQPPWQFR